MSRFRSVLQSGEILVADGAMGTTLMERGLRPGDCPEALNLRSPEVLEEVARLYAEAGADIVQTNTFGGSPLKLATHDLADEAAAINRAAVEAVRRAVGSETFVSGSCGPCGRILTPYGDTDPEVVQASFRVQLAALVEAGVDVVCIETMTDLREAELALSALREVSAELPVMMTMTFEPTPRGFFTMMGTDVETAAKGLTRAGADVVGSNCGNGSRAMIEVAAAFRAATDLPIIVQPNAGLPERVGTELRYGEDPTFMAETAREILAAGATIIGGCCGTTFAHIAALRELVDELQKSRQIPP